MEAAGPLDECGDQLAGISQAYCAVALFRLMRARTLGAPWLIASGVIGVCSSAE